MVEAIRDQTGKTQTEIMVQDVGVTPLRTATNDGVRATHDERRANERATDETRV